jgi:hypothetical protein
MTNGENIYVSLEEAKKEIEKRWVTEDLKKEIEKELGTFLITDLEKTPRAVLCRPIISPDNGFNFFEHCARYIGCRGIGLEYTEDKFVVLNSEKRGLSKLRITRNGIRGWYDTVDCNKEQGKKIIDVLTKINNKKLVDFHHEIYEFTNADTQIIDHSLWFKRFTGPAEYYYYFLLNFVVHGVYFDLFDTEMDQKENSFVHSMVIPNIQKIKDKFGLYPLIVKLYPDDQTPEDDFYWFAYNHFVNDRIVSIAEESNLEFHQFNFKSV